MNNILRKTIWVLPFGTVFLLFALVFFHHPTMDDYAGDLLVKRDGLARAIYLYLKNSNGRYFVVPIFLTLTSINFFLDHYFILLLVFLIYTYFCFYFFVGKTLKEFFENRFTDKVRLHWITSFFLIVCLSVIPEASSFIYWLTTDVVYLLPFTLTLFYLLYLIRPFRNGVIPRSRYLLFVFLSFVLIGSNEVSIFFSFCFLILASLYYWLLHKKLSDFHITGIICQLVFIAIGFLLPGNVSRSEGFSVKQPLAFSLVSGLYQTAGIFFSLLANTFFWVGVLAVVYLSSSTKQGSKPLRLNGFAFIAGIFVIFFLNFFFCFFIRHWTGWVVPERSKNIMVLLTMLFLFTITYLYVYNVRPQLPKIMGQLSVPLGTFFVLLYLFNPFFIKLIQTTMLASVHDSVLDQRIAVANTAQQSGKKSITLQPYKQEFVDELKRQYGTKVANFVAIEFPIPPPLMYFKDEPFDPTLGFMYAEYYNIDSIKTPGRIILR